MKKTIFIIMSVIFILVIIFMILKKDVDIYLSLAGNAQFDKIDMSVKINENMVFQDTVYYTTFSSGKITYPLRSGFHKITVNSNVANLSEEKTIFILWNQYIFIEFYGKMKYIRDNPELKIGTKCNPYYIE